MWREPALCPGGLALREMKSSGLKALGQVLLPEPEPRWLALPWGAGLFPRRRCDQGTGGPGPYPAWMPHGPQNLF